MHTNDIAEASYGMKILGQTSAGVVVRSWQGSRKSHRTEANPS